MSEVSTSTASQVGSPSENSDKKNDGIRPKHWGTASTNPNESCTFHQMAGRFPSRTVACTKGKGSVVLLPLGYLSQYIFGPILFILSLFIIGVILLQRGKGGGLTGALGGMGGQSAFGVKAGDLFTRITAVAVLMWIFVCALACRWYRPEKLDMDADLGVTSSISAGPEGFSPAPEGLGGASALPAEPAPPPAVPAPAVPAPAEPAPDKTDADSSAPTAPSPTGVDSPSQESSGIPPAEPGSEPGSPGIEVEGAGTESGGVNSGDDSPPPAE
jgi:preprotein translocase subunit SecG